MKLYYHPLSPNCRKVLATVAHTGVEVEHHVVDFASGELRGEEFLAINPNGKVPALVDGDLKLWESNAVMAYLAGKVDSPLWPRTNDRYDIMRWFNFEAAHFAPGAATVAYERVIKPMVGGGDPDPVAIERGLTDFRRYAGVLDGVLDGQPYVCGDQLTLADFSLASALTYAAPSQLPVHEFPNVGRWNNALNELEAWRATAPKPG